MDDRLTGVAAAVVGAALAAAGFVEYVRAGFAPPPYDPFATGVFVAGAGLLLFAAGAVALAAGLDGLALRAATGVGLGTLVLALLLPEALLFGGVFWLALVAIALVAAGAYRTVSMAR